MYQTFFNVSDIFQCIRHLSNDFPIAQLCPDFQTYNHSMIYLRIYLSKYIAKDFEDLRNISQDLLRKLKATSIFDYTVLLVSANVFENIYYTYGNKHLNPPFSK